jgi:glycosyltransferase involved in cell wall biosynthesis
MTSVLEVLPNGAHAVCTPSVVRFPEVVHVSATPLVAAPAKIAAAYSRIGAPALALAHGDYPGALADLFSHGYVFWKDSTAVQRSAALARLARADVVHVHNDLPPEFAETVLRASEQATFVYHVHSPQREGPLYVDRSETLGFPFAAKLVVGQVWPRLWPDHRPVPNIVDAAPSVSERRRGERLRVLYSPSHSRDGRWGGKRSDALDDALAGLARAGLIEAVIPEKPMAPHLLLELRRHCHVTVDEIVTGGHHQVSLEGLCCGNAVVTGADFFSKAMACAATGAAEPPPFVHADPSTVADVLAELARDPERTAVLQRQSYEYFRRWLSPDQLATRYLDVYREVLSAKN